jgi:hypothetical protein
MASRTLDDLNEFFDFEQLEHDHGAQASSDRQHVGSYNPELDTVMDWTASDLVPLPAEHVLLPQNVHIPNIFDNVGIHDHSQWPLANVPVQSFPEENPSIDSNSFPGFVEASISDPQYPPNAAPLSSSTAYDPLNPTGYEVRTTGGFSATHETQLLASPKPSLEVVAAPSLVKDGSAPSRSRPTALLRQGSTASWKPASAKRKGAQGRIPLEAKQILEDEFIANPYPCSWEMDIIAHQANLDVKKVRNWFNNTRARKKGGGGCSFAMLSQQICLLVYRTRAYQTHHLK